MTLDAFTTTHYADLLAHAERLMRHGEPGTTANDLLHESYLRLASAHTSMTLADSTHGRRLYHQAMQRTLVDRARRRKSKRRGGRYPHVDVTSLGDSTALTDTGDAQTTVNDALDYVARYSPKGAHVLRLRCFHGYTQQEVAAQLSVSLTTLKRHRRRARRLLAAAWGIPH